MRLTPEELQKETAHFLNVICNEKEQQSFIELMSRDHRTLQQNYTRFVLKWIKAQAESEYYDLRNKNSVMLCKKIMDTIKDECYLPYI